MPVALAPCVMTWKPDGKAGAPTRKPTTARARTTRGKGTRCRCLTVSPPSIVRRGTQGADGSLRTTARQSRPRRGQSQRSGGDRASAAHTIGPPCPDESELPDARRLDAKPGRPRGARPRRHDPRRALPHRRRARLRRHGRRLPRARPQARPGHRAEAHPPRPRLARAARDAAARDHPRRARSRTRTSAASTTSSRSTARSSSRWSTCPARR